MRLNGWQRLWVVAVALWTLAVGVYAWGIWPPSEGETISVFPLTTVDYYDAVAHLVRWGEGDGRPTPNFHSFANQAGHVFSVRDPADRLVVKFEWNMPEPPSSDDLPRLFAQARQRQQKQPRASDASALTEVGNSEPLVEIPIIGLVLFPNSMSLAQAETASEKLAAEHEQLLHKINEKGREALSAKRRATIRIGVEAWLLPPIILYAFGWALGWIYRGFRVS